MYAYIEVQMISAVITLILLFCNQYEMKQATRFDKLMNLLFAINLTKIACYMAAILLEGNARLAWLDSIMTCGKCGFGFPMLFAFTMYIMESVDDKRKEIKVAETISYAICILATSWNVLSIFFPLVYSCEGGIYRRGPLFMENQMVAVIVMVMDSYIVWKCKEKLGSRNTMAMIFYCVIPMVTGCAQIFLPPEPDVSNIGITLGILTVFFMAHIERGRELAEKERELTEMHISILVSQIRPHFLYNVLAVIQEMCHDKAPDAEETVMEFSEYLRGNVDSIDQVRTIPFQKELKHTKLFLSLEQKRFGDALRVNFDIREEDFFLPPLILEPMVENAVKYGVMQREEGGTVSISTRRVENAYEILVTDDGNGFDVNQKIEDGRSHVGISNVRRRLEDMCHGSLKIDSIPGHGTTVIITIPEE